MSLILTPEQSAARIRELQAQGYEVTMRTLEDGSVVVYTSQPGASWGWLLLLLISLGGCGLASSRRR